MNKPCNKCEHSFEFKNKKYHRYDNICHNCEKYKKYQQYRLSKRKYENSGVVVESIEDLLNNEWFIWHEQTRHRTFFLNQQLQCILHWISQQDIYVAKLKDKRSD